MTRGHNRVMSKSEIMGRLASCGFEIIETIDHKGLSYFLSKKQTIHFFQKNFKDKEIAITTGRSGRVIKYNDDVHLAYKESKKLCYNALYWFGTEGKKYLNKK